MLADSEIFPVLCGNAHSSSDYGNTGTDATLLLPQTHHLLAPVSSPQI